MLGNFYNTMPKPNTRVIICENVYIVPKTVVVNINDIVGDKLNCHPKLQELKAYFEGIITWANLYNFPVIVNSGFYRGYSEYDREDSVWYSFLRMFPHVDRSMAKEIKPNRSMTGNFDHKLELYFLNSCGNYSVEACIEWTEGKIDIQIDNNYFYDGYVGAIVHPADVLSNGLPNVNELETMFQFLFHRFVMVEIISNSNFSEVIEAVKIVSTSKTAPSLSTLSSSAFLGYQIFETDVEVESKSKLLEFLNEVDKSQTEVVKGIHIDLTELPVEPEPKTFFKKIFESLNQFISFQKARKEKTGKKSKFKVGIAIHWRFDFFEDFLITGMLNDRNVDLLNKVDYIIFREKVSRERGKFANRSLNNKRAMKIMFYGHLRLKRVVAQLFPHVKVYFRLEVNDGLDDDKSMMKDYLRFISHMKKFAMSYNIHYFVVEAFDNEFDMKNGWWKITNSSDLMNPKSYVEREAVFNNRKMWDPSKIVLNDENPTNVTTVLNSESSTNFVIIVVIASSVGILIVLILSMALLTSCIRYRKLQQYLSDAEVEHFLNGGTGNPSQNQTGGQIDLARFNSEYEILMSDLFVDAENILGSGNFGTVYKGSVKGVPAAVKKHNQDCSKATFLSFLNEVKVLCHIGIHPNVVSIVGAYVKEIQKGFLMIATELCANGSLEDFLRKHKTVVSRRESHDQQNNLCNHDLHRFAKEVASGMAYIESRHVVHGDLSSRNVLLDDNLTCKIGDFGLSRKLYEYQKYVKTSQEPLPWKWMAYEALVKMEFTSKSDVWSYGVTLWEIYSLGCIPYGGLAWTTGFADELTHGLRLTMPQYASEQIYSKMKECWNLDPEQRPEFAVLAMFFKNLYDTQYTIL